MQASGGVTQVSIFRPISRLLPTVSNGDVMLLRNFQVQSFSRQLYLKSQEDSSWAVFPCQLSHQSQSPEAVISAIPVEYSTKEQLHAHHLSKWWVQIGHQLQPRPPPKRQQMSLSAISEGLFFDLRGQLVQKPSSLTSPYIICVADDTSKAGVDPESLDSLGDLDSRIETAYLAIELRLQDARFALASLKEGDTVYCSNVLAQKSNHGKFTGIIQPELAGSISVWKCAD